MTDTQPSRAIGVFLAITVALFLILLIILCNSPNPVTTLKAFFIGPWGSPWFLGNTLDSISLLLTASLGAVLAFRGGCFNLGAEGQIYVGGLAASMVILGGEGFLDGKIPGLVILILAFLSAAAAGGAMGAVSGLLKKQWGANELITSFLLSAALSPAADYIISGPLRDQGENLLASPRFPQRLTLLHIFPPSNLSVSCIFALLLVIGGHLFINNTVWGYRFRIAGTAPDFARFGGIQSDRYWTPAMTAAGGLSGITGFFAVAGTYGLCHLGFPGGLGWNAIAVALIARNHPLLLLPAALIYGWLKAGSDSALLATGLSFESSSFIQAAVLLLATIQIVPLRHLSSLRHFLSKKARHDRGPHD